ncbi:MAG TPA: amidohydrolase family protein [Acidimicrobiales bacterium]|nr:amidohydrolase family protein [Acidimicrobiales bacterium]
MHDLVIRNATVVDGTGAERFAAGVTVDGGIITTVGDLPAGARGAEEIDARDLLVTPGFVDVHTHYDGQVTWDPLLSPSCWHGVTTAVMGNCGVGFAPVRPAERDWLIQLMEGVEDIPGSALAEGIAWDWESFPEYLDALDRFPRAIDVAAQIPHGSLRAYVMGQRAVGDAPPTDADLAGMAGLVREAMLAGAIGFSSNRLPLHTAKDGTPVPGTFAEERELFAIGRVLGDLGIGIIEVVTAGAMGEDPNGYEREIAWMRRLSAETRRPITYGLSQINHLPDKWRVALELTVDAVAGGARLVPQVPARPLGILIGLSTKHGFTGRPSFDEVSTLPLRQLTAALRDPERRRRILSETSQAPGVGRMLSRNWDRLFPLGADGHEIPDYEPLPSQSIAAIAAREGRPAEHVAYDLMCAGERALLLFTMGGYAHRDHDDIHDMLVHPLTVLGLGDGGAHCGLICDASTTTSMISHWSRDRTRGPRIPLELAVRKMTGDTAQLCGLGDRGVVAPGRRADLNVIDLDRLQLRLPEAVDDLPAGARRMVQRADGYVATIVAGEVVLREGEDMGARPGHLVRGPR